MHSKCTAKWGPRNSAPYFPIQCSRNQNGCRTDGRFFLDFVGLLPISSSVCDIFSYLLCSPCFPISAIHCKMNNDRAIHGNIVFQTEDLFVMTCDFSTVFVVVCVRENTGGKSDPRSDSVSMLFRGIAAVKRGTKQGDKVSRFISLLPRVPFP